MRPIDDFIVQTWLNFTFAYEIPQAMFSFADLKFNPYCNLVTNF